LDCKCWMESKATKRTTLLVQPLTMTNLNGYSKVSKAKTILIASYHNKRHLGPICEKSTQSQLWVMHHCHTIHTHCLSFLDGNIGRDVILHNCKFESLHLGSISTWSNNLEIWKVWFDAIVLNVFNVTSTIWISFNAWLLKCLCVCAWFAKVWDCTLHPLPNLWIKLLRLYMKVNDNLCHGINNSDLLNFATLAARL
jgi:hypothetical protein